MKIEMRINGKFSLEHTPETVTEKLVLAEMADRSSKGKTVHLTPGPDGGIVVSVEQ